MIGAFSELLWIFTLLPDDYVVLDTETTGLPDESGLPDIVSLGLTVVRQREIQNTFEFRIKPQKPISAEAQAIHGITSEDAAAFEPFDAQCPQILQYLETQLVVIHNASFDWPILLDHIARSGFTLPPLQGVLCSQKAAMAWAVARDVPCAARGPSLDALTRALNTKNLRALSAGKHEAGTDCRQAFINIEELRNLAEAALCPRN